MKNKKNIDGTYNTYYNKLMKDKELLKLLLKNGWKENRVHGSHYILVKDNKTISLPIHDRDTPKGMLNKILKQTDLV